MTGAAPPGAAVAAGLECCRCGRCCEVEGYVYLSAEDLDRAAAYLGMPVEAFTARYTRLRRDRQGLSFTEKPDGSCVFFKPERTCRIHAAKPKQCREFPATWRFAGAEAICEALSPPKHSAHRREAL